MGGVCGCSRLLDPRQADGKNGRESWSSSLVGMVKENSEYIIGRNSVREALRAGDQIDKLIVIKGLTDGSIREIVNMARRMKIIVREVSRYKMDEICAGMGPEGTTGNHQGIAAQIPAFRYSDLSDIYALAGQKGEEPFVIVLENVQDPQNLGAIIRSCEALGAHGVVIGKHRSASLTPAVFKASSGAAAHIPVVKVTNINQTIEEFKKRGIFAVAADMEGQPLSTANLTGAIALVIGGEGGGVTKLTKEICDFAVFIEMSGRTESLNAACAASILMYEKRRQDLVNP